jgi:hypothetical protein
MGDGNPLSTEDGCQASKDQVKCVQDWAIGCLKELKTGCQEGEGWKKTVLRVVELSSGNPGFYLAAAKVEGYEV